jgi:hypothetical protein
MFAQQSIVNLSALKCVVTATDKSAVRRKFYVLIIAPNEDGLFGRVGAGSVEENEIF